MNARAASTGVIRRLLSNGLGAASIVTLAVVVLSTAFAGVLGLPAPSAGSLIDAFQPPGPGHLLGTDTTGRDILSRLLWGGQVTLLGAALTVAVSFAVGVPSAIIAGYYGGWFDRVSGWFASLLMALPGIVVLLAVRAVFGPSVWLAMAVFGVILSPMYFRLARTAVQGVRRELYIDAAVVSGVSDTRILFRHVVAVVRAPIAIQGARLAVVAISIQAALEFLGIGDLSVPSWGGMLNDSFRRMTQSPLLLLWPSLAIGITTIALVLFANALRDAWEGSSSVGRDDHGPGPDAPAEDPVTHSDDVEAARSHDELLCIRDLRVSYGPPSDPVEVVHGVSFDVRAGEVLGLVGESGSGKSQTAFSVLGLLPQAGRISGGNITVAGLELTTLSERRYDAVRGSEIAYVPQEPMTNLDPAATIGRQLIRPMQKKLGLSRAAARTRALELLARVGIADPERTLAAYPFQISGGMAQRVLIAGAVSCRPRLLIADEPTTALDVSVQAEVLGLLRELQRDDGMAVLLVTHNLGVVADICDRVAVMSGGRIVESGSTRTVLREPQHGYTKSLMDAMLDEASFRDARHRERVSKETVR